MIGQDAVSRCWADSIHDDLQTDVRGADTTPANWGYPAEDSYERAGDRRIGSLSDGVNL